MGFGMRVAITLAHLIPPHTRSWLYPGCLMCLEAVRLGIRHESCAHAAMPFHLPMLDIYTVANYIAAYQLSWFSLSAGGGVVRGSWHRPGGAAAFAQGGRGKQVGLNVMCPISKHWFSAPQAWARSDCTWSVRHISSDNVHAPISFGKCWWVMPCACVDGLMRFGHLLWLRLGPNRCIWQK